MQETEGDLKSCVSQLLATAPKSTDAMPKRRNPGTLAKINGFLTLGHCSMSDPMQFQFQETQGPWRKNVS